MVLYIKFTNKFWPFGFPQTMEFCEHINQLPTYEIPSVILASTIWPFPLLYLSMIAIQIPIVHTKLPPANSEKFTGGLGFWEPYNDNRPLNICNNFINTYKAFCHELTLY